MLTPSLGLSADGRRRWGRSVRKMVPRSIHSVWLSRPGRPDPVAIVDGENALTYEGLLDGEPFIPVPANNGGFKGGIRMSSWLVYWR